MSYIHLLRPHQWVKNMLLFFPPFFAGKMFAPSTLSAAYAAFVSFSMAASCMYIINDLKDVEADKNHATKKHRSIARGDVSPLPAFIIAAALYLTSMLLSSAVSRTFEWFIMLYFLVSLMYTFFLKEIIIVDIFIIAFGFIIRVLAGGEAFGIVVTNWLFMTVFAVSLMLAAGKRLGELISLGEDAPKHRKIFTLYSHSFLEGVLWFAASASLVTYALYTLEHKNGLFYTVPLAAFGLVRYMYIVKSGNGDPTDALMKDGQIMGVGMLWAAAIGIIIYK
jgi:4-hydroxybenzoate polyprenyltransferase